MEARVETLKPKKLVGTHMEMSLAENSTGELWQAFMPRRAEVQNRVNTDFISMQVYAADTKNLFEPATRFTKWAVVEVSSFKEVPAGMETYHLKGGRYAVFFHNGPAHTFPKTMNTFFTHWLPRSGYTLDAREHFEILPENYNPTDPDAREEIWIPIK